MLILKRNVYLQNTIHKFGYGVAIFQHIFTKFIDNVRLHKQTVLTSSKLLRPSISAAFFMNALKELYLSQTSPRTVQNRVVDIMLLASYELISPAVELYRVFLLWQYGRQNVEIRL
jgi:hypothetical protein